MINAVPKGVRTAVTFGIYRSSIHHTSIFVDPRVVDASSKILKKLSQYQAATITIRIKKWHLLSDIKRVKVSWRLRKATGLRSHDD